MASCFFFFFIFIIFFFFQAEDGIRDVAVTGVQTCALPICCYCDLGSLPVLAECCLEQKKNRYSDADVSYLQSALPGRSLMVLVDSTAVQHQILASLNNDLFCGVV